MNNMTLYTNRLVRGLINFACTRTFKQTCSLYASNTLSILLLFAINIVNARYLGKETFGIYSFTMAVLIFTSSFFEFGFLSAGARLLAIAEGKDQEREILGIITFVMTIVCFIYGIFILGLSFVVDYIFEDKVGHVLLMIVPFSMFLPLKYFTLMACRGTNRVDIRSFDLIFQNSFYLLTFFAVVRFISLSYSMLLTIYLISIFASCAISILWMRPSFSNLGYNLGKLTKEVKTYGIHVYIGRALSMSSYDLDRLFISYFHGATQVGIYSIGRYFARSMSVIGTSLTHSIFKDLTRCTKVDKTIQLFNAGMLILGALAIMILGRPVVHIAFGLEYSSVVPLLIPVGILGFLNSFYYPYNCFLHAHGLGKQLRTCAFTTSGANILFNLLLIPFYGPLGAVWAGVFAMAVSNSLHIYYYIKRPLNLLERQGIPQQESKNEKHTKCCNLDGRLRQSTEAPNGRSPKMSYRGQRQEYFGANT